MRVFIGIEDNVLHKTQEPGGIVAWIWKRFGMKLQCLLEKHGPEIVHIAGITKSVADANSLLDIEPT